MQYFSIVARKDGLPPRTCAMLQDSTLQTAATKARQLIESTQLPHVDRRSSFSIRKSSRRETSLLQSFMATRTQDRISTYLPEDLDSLLSRRNTMLLSFFMALYIDPDKLKRRFAPQVPGRPDSNSPSGSGGVTMDASEVNSSVKDDEAVSADAEIENTSSTTEDNHVSEEPDIENQTVGDDNQLSALEDIVNGGGGHETGDDEMDLF